MNKTAISWTDLTWNPWSGCTEVSTECKFCYARALAEQKRGPAFPLGFGLTFREHKLAEIRRLKEPSIIFVNSMSDFWITAAEMGQPEVEESLTKLRNYVLDLFEAYPQHQFQVLTKRPQNIMHMLDGRPIPGNVWIGVTCGHASQLWRIDELLQIPARIRFVSIEPLLSQMPSLDLTGIGWVITGGESGLHLRDPAIRAKRGLAEFIDGKWVPHRERAQIVRDIDGMCQILGIAHWFKQWGGVRPESGGHLLDGREVRKFPAHALWESSHKEKLKAAGLI